MLGMVKQIALNFLLEAAFFYISWKNLSRVNKVNTLKGLGFWWQQKFYQKLKNLIHILPTLWRSVRKGEHGEKAVRFSSCYQLLVA